LSTPDRSTEPGATPNDPRWRPTPTRIVVALILLVGIVVPLLVSTYAFDEPRLWGFPFFYWYQLVWVFIAAALCGVAFLLLKRERHRFEREHPKTPSGGAK
jgi:uncharacterized membrane protein